jgi:hypothetical protein
MKLLSSPLSSDGRNVKSSHEPKPMLGCHSNVWKELHSETGNISQLSTGVFNQASKGEIALIIAC